MHLLFFTLHMHILFFMYLISNYLGNQAIVEVHILHTIIIQNNTIP